MILDCVGQNYNILNVNDRLVVGVVNMVFETRNGLRLKLELNCGASAT